VRHNGGANFRFNQNKTFVGLVHDGAFRFKCYLKNDMEQPPAVHPGANLPEMVPVTVIITVGNVTVFGQRGDKIRNRRQLRRLWEKSLGGDASRRRIRKGGGHYDLDRMKWERWRLALAVERKEKLEQREALWHYEEVSWYGDC
jgi:hypothetical protein